MVLYANTILPQSLRLELLLLLSRHGADLSHVNQRGDTTLIKALNCQEFIIIKVFLRINVKINQTTGDGNTLLLLLCESRLSILEKAETMDLIVYLSCF